MASEITVEAPVATSAVLLAASKHISTKCRAENKAFLCCKKTDPNPEKCLSQGDEVTKCVFSLLRELHGKCPKEINSYSGCMHYYGNEFELCRREQKQFECACPLTD